jgi:predicted TIM-barrel fold metal-dependent hydrolase
MVTSLRYEDIDWCVKEMTRMRERGSRTFFLPGEPVNLVPPYDPYFDPVWAAACDLGMVGLYHVGASLTKWNPGWGNTDDPNVMSQVNAAGSHFNAHIMINAMIFGGVFHRYPNFTMQISEFGFEWLPYAVRHMDKRTSDTGQSMIGKYAWPLKPSEFVRRNVRMSGLPGQDPRVMLETMPEAIAFASDYPHMEGSPSPIEYYSPFLQGADEATRSGYFADNMLEVYARMGDPLPVPA